MLLVVAVGVNLDRFTRDAPPLRAHDFADNNITMAASCGEFWRSGLASDWDGSQLRGWPRVESARHPQTLWCLFGAVTPMERIASVMHALLLAMIAVGSFLFARFFLWRSHEASIAGALLFVGMFYFFHEHPGITSATLLPAMAGFAALPATTWRVRMLQLAGAMAIIALSNPPGTLVAMPLGHLVLILAAPREERLRHLHGWAVAWFAYAIYFAPTVLSQVQGYEQSSRSLFGPSAMSASFRAVLTDRLMNAAILSPGLALIALVGRPTWAQTLLLAAVIVGIVGLSAANEAFVMGEFARAYPWLLSASTLYYRFYYFVPVALLVWGTRLVDATRAEHWGLFPFRAALLGLIYWFAAVPLAETSRVFDPVDSYVLVLGALALTARWWARHAVTALLVAAATMWFGRQQYEHVYEVPSGNLFVEAPFLGEPPALRRAVTIMETCDSVGLFPAQAAAAGLETLDGIANLYSASFAERWRHFVADNPSICTGRYATWNTRAEVTLNDLQAAGTRIIPWLWINNVGLVRSPAALDHPSLELAGQHDFVVDNGRPVSRFLYRMRDPVGRVFTVPTELAMSTADAGLKGEEKILHELRQANWVQNVDATAVDSSHLRFRGAFARNRTVLINVNYHPGWQLWLDGRRIENGLSPGPFGMIQVRAVAGEHDFALVFSSPRSYAIPFFMLAATVVFWFGAPLSSRLGALRIPLSRPGIWLAAALTVAGLALVAVRVLGKSDVPWLEGSWRTRLRIESKPTGTTSAVRGFPLRVEFPPDHALWDGLDGSSGELRFTDATGLRLLPHEVEEFDFAKRRFVAWVRIPRLEPWQSTVAFLYRGTTPQTALSDPGAVWVPGYTGVWHLNPATAPDGLASDSTGHGHDAQSKGMSPSPADTGVWFDGRPSTSVEIPNWPGMHSASGDWTVEFRLRAEPAASRQFGLLEHRGAHGLFHLYLHSSGYPVLERLNGATASEIGLVRDVMPRSEWLSFSISRVEGALRTALNGNSTAEYATSAFRDAAFKGPLRLGNGPYGPLHGRLAELRITLGHARSPDWARAVHMSAASAFLSFGPVEIR